MASTEGADFVEVDRAGDETLRAIGALSALARTGVPAQAVLALCVEAMEQAVPDAVVRTFEGGREAHDLDHLPEGSRVVLSLEAGGGPFRTIIAGCRRPFTPTEAQRLHTIAAAASAALTAGEALEASRIDPLTRVLSRSALRERLEAEVARAQRDAHELACIVLDLDAFKAVNDDLGHLVGDDVLRTVGAVLAAAVRPFDHVGRIGGDEFVVLMPGVSLEEAPASARRLHEAISQRARVEGGQHVTCSLGIACWEPGMTAHGLLEHADHALLAAKRGGGDGVVAAGRRLRDLALDEAGSTALRLALAGEGVAVCFQPICGLEDGALAGYEALSRGPAGLERPELLLAAAREAGELVPLDERLHREALRAAERLELSSPLTLFVNIEPETLVGLVGDDRFWRRTTRSFASLSEVTERALLDRPGALLRACQRLRELGWGIALDDIGTDVRALALLPLIAPDVIKLDLRMVQQPPSPQLASTVIAIAACVEATGTRLVAAGIETEEHRERAMALGADYGQGWLFGRPSRELTPGAGIAPLPRVPSPRMATGVTPFQLVAATSRPRVGSEGLLHELQAAMERRAAGVGQASVLVTALGPRDLDPEAEGRLAALAPTLGCVGFLGDEASRAPVGRLRTERLDPADPLRAEWVTAVVSPYSAMVLAARRDDGHRSRWRFAISHSTEVAQAVAGQLLTRLP